MASSEAYDPVTAEAVAHAYDAEAQSTGWLGGEVAFGLAYEYVLPGQSLLDLGIGTGWVGVFRRQDCGCTGGRFHDDGRHLRWKATKISLGLTWLGPLPYAAESFDHVVCIAVLNSSAISPLCSPRQRG